MPLIRRQEQRVLRLILNRAEKRNALNEELASGIVRAVESAQDDPSVGAVLLSAEGKVFSAGMDLEEAGGKDAAARTAIHEKLFTIFDWSRKPVVVAVQGPALGGGVGLVANAHVALAAQGSSFGLTEVRLGLWPFLIYRSLVHAMGERRTLELSLTGRIFDLPQAIQFGLIHEAVPAFELEDRAEAVAHGLAESSAQAIASGLGFAAEARGLELKDALKVALRTREKVLGSADFTEGLAARREKRAPVWPSAGSRDEGKLP